MPSEKKPGTVLFDSLGRASVMGLHMVSGIMVGGGLGYGVDRWLETAPWGMLIGFVFGIAAGFRNLWIDAKLLIKNEETKTKGPHDDPPLH